jgi:biopolymer transport protein ExbD
MRFPRNAKLFRGQLDAAAFASVFFLLVIFLLLHSAFVFVPGVKLDLPEAGEWPGVVGPTRVVVLDRHGQVYYENQAVTEDRLRARLAEAVRRSPEPLKLVVFCDEAAANGAWLRLARVAREAGIDELVTAARPPLFPQRSSESGAR